MPALISATQLPFVVLFYSFLIMTKAPPLNSTAAARTSPIALRAIEHSQASVAIVRSAGLVRDTSYWTFARFKG